MRFSLFDLPIRFAGRYDDIWSMRSPFSPFIDLLIRWALRPWCVSSCEQPSSHAGHLPSLIFNVCAPVPESIAGYWKSASNQSDGEIKCWHKRNRSHCFIGLVHALRAVYSLNATTVCTAHVSFCVCVQHAVRARSEYFIDFGTKKNNDFQTFYPLQRGNGDIIQSSDNPVITSAINGSTCRR